METTKCENWKRVVAVVVTYNRKDMLLECLKALKEQTYKAVTIYIIDNASTDGTRDAVESFVDNKNIMYFNTGSNLGGAGGFNFGMRLAAQAECDYVWLMDEDTIPENNAIAELVRSAELLNDDFGFLSSYVLFTNGSFCKMNRQLAMEKEWIEDCELLKAGLLRIKRASFVSLLVRKQTIISEGLPIKEFFIWGDDTEYTYRLSLKNRCFFIKDSIVIHKTSNNNDTSADTFVFEKSDDKVERYYYNYRNWCYISKKYEGASGILKEIKRFITLNGKLFFRCKYHKWKKIGILWKGYLAGLFFNPKIEFPI